MKEKDLYVDFAAQQHVYYVEKDDHSFGPLISGSQLSKNYLDDYWQKIRQLEQQLRDRLTRAEISPVYYYMMLQELSAAELASRARVSLRRLRLHLTPAGFMRMRTLQLVRYAEVFNVPAAALLQTILLKDELKPSVGVTHQSTGNPLFSVVKIEPVQA